MKALLLITLAVVSLATSACTTTAGSGYYLPLPPLPIPQRIETANPNYSHNNYDSCEPSYLQETTYFVGPQYYRTNVPYHHGNIRNYTDAPIIAPSACNPHTNIIIPNSWN